MIEQTVNKTTLLHNRRWAKTLHDVDLPQVPDRTNKQLKLHWSKDMHSNRWIILQRNLPLRNLSLWVFQANKQVIKVRLAKLLLQLSLTILWLILLLCKLLAAKEVELLLKPIHIENVTLTKRRVITTQVLLVWLKTNMLNHMIKIMESSMWKLWFLIIT